VTFRIVLVDDDRDVRIMWRHVLELSSGFEVVGEAGSGSEALVVCRQQRPDAVVTDWDMPDLDGVSLARQLRSEHRAMTVLLCSSRPSEAVPRDLVDLGVAHLDKINSAHLPELLTRLLSTGPSQPPGGRAGGVPGQQ
jgi:DNA-binding NarL/FixJ family response regulator